MRCVANRSCDRYEIVDQPFAIGLAPALTALPKECDFLDMPVQQLQELDRVGILEPGLFRALSATAKFASVIGEFRQTYPQRNRSLSSVKPSLQARSRSGNGRSAPILPVC